MPVIYLTNAASVAAVARGNAKPETTACVGPAPVLSIMRFPREEMGEAGVGRVLALTPPSKLAAPAIAAKKAADVPDRARWDGEWWIPVGVVVDGATLICACSREASATGRCHRVIAADLLKRAGWTVVLDGRSL